MIIQNIKTVSILEIKPHDFDLKDDITKNADSYRQYRRIYNCLRLYGQTVPIIVREILTDSVEKYEIIDGIQRYKALKELNEPFVLINNLGSVSDSEALKLAIYHSRSFLEPDMINEALKLKELLLQNDIDKLPYSEEEIRSRVGLLNFDWSQFEDNESGQESLFGDEQPQLE